MDHRSCIFRFADVVVDESAFSVTKAGDPLALEPKVFKVLQVLLHHPGRVVTKDELLEAVWSDTSVSDSSLTRSVATLRRLLGDDIHEPRYIATVPTVGYRFLCEVQVSGNGFVPGAASDTKQELPPEPASTLQAAPLKELRPGARRTLAVLIASSMFVLLAAAGWFAYSSWSRNNRAMPVDRSLTRLTFDEGLQAGSTWSPDGRFVAYSSDRGGKFDIWVQQVSGGDPIQITKRPGQNSQPNWSPDGKFIAYRSDEGDGGIYVTPALGGAGLERRIAPFGYYPQWSPDSSQVLFRTHFTAFGFPNRYYIARLDGSPPREVLAGFIAQNNLWAPTAAWHPDGKRITLWAGSSSPTPAFWTVPLAGGPGIKLEIPPAVQKELAEASGETKAGLQLGEYHFYWSPSGDAIYFVRGYRGARNIWKLTVDPGTMHATGIDRLTTGPGPESGLAVSPDGKRLVFTATSQRIQTWLFPFDARSGQIKGSGSAITSPGRTSIDPKLSPDGTKVAYVVPYGESNGLTFADVRNEVWVKSLVDGSEFPVSADDYSRWATHWSGDSKQLLYERRNLRTNERQLMIWSGQTQGEESLVAPNPLGIPFDWSGDGKWLLMYRPTGLWSVPFPSSQSAKTAAKQIAANPASLLYQPRISYDNRWIVFEAVTNSPIVESALYVVPASGGPWTRITDGRHWDDKPRWSPDGKTIYFVSKPGGFFNVWGIRFDPSTGKAVGQPFQVSRFDTPRLTISGSIPAVGFSLTQDKLVLTMEQESGNIWILDNVDR